MKKWISLIVACMTFPLVANMGPQGFGQFLNPVFVETGTFGGDGVQKALDTGFPLVLSIEADEGLFKAAKRRFRLQPNVRIYQGDSATDLYDMISTIREPITFWLDAHIYPPRADGGKNCPLIEELEQIKQHPIKTHTILIDDMHCCGTAAFDFMTREDFIRKLLEINPNYRIFYVDGGDEGEYKDNVMVAVPA
jgi:hypothetical protein